MWHSRRAKSWNLNREPRSLSFFPSILSMEKTAKFHFNLELQSQIVLRTLRKSQTAKKKKKKRGDRSFLYATLIWKSQCCNQSWSPLWRVMKAKCWVKTSFSSPCDETWSKSGNSEIANRRTLGSWSCQTWFWSCIFLSFAGTGKWEDPQLPAERQTQ